VKPSPEQLSFSRVELAALQPLTAPRTFFSGKSSAARQSVICGPFLRLTCHPKKWTGGWRNWTGAVLKKERDCNETKQQRANHLRAQARGGGEEGELEHFQKYCGRAEWWNLSRRDK
jgi:hypothetical protein